MIVRRWLPFILLVATLAVLTAAPQTWRVGLSLLFPGQQPLLYTRADPAFLLGQHLLLVFVSSLMSIAVGVGLGVTVTRPGGRAFMPAVERLAAIGQTFPPAAVLALAVPALGFGFYPTVAALFLYSVLPILRNTLAGVTSVPPEAMEAARGMGMTGVQALMRIELPLAFPAILAGVRTSVVVNVGTATIGATIGAGGLGAPIISGLVNQNPAFLVEGALTAGLLSLALDAGFAAIAAAIRKPGQVSETSGA